MHHVVLYYFLSLFTAVYVYGYNGRIFGIQARIVGMDLADDVCRVDLVHSC